MWLIFLASSCLLGCRNRSMPGQDGIDPATGHRVLLLSRRPGSNETLYFHQNPFTETGDKMVFIGNTEKGRNAFTVDLKTFEVQQVTDLPVGLEVVAARRRELFYLSGETVYATHLDTRVTREIARVPASYQHGRGLSLNADETLLAGCFCQGEETYYQKMPREEWIQALFRDKLPNAIYTIQIETGEVQEFYREDEWLGHVQFSPTDPELLEFCHEGPERELDRMWTIRTTETQAHNVYEKTFSRELVTHEFWDPSGAAIWFDLQVPRWLSRKIRPLEQVLFPSTYLARIDLETGKTQRFPLKVQHYCWHYNVSPDGRLLCGDGEGRSFRVCPSGRWIYLFRPNGNRLKVERLCSMKGHSYKIAPNAHFTPDGQWVVFQSDTSGTSQVYAVQIARSGNK